MTALRGRRGFTLIEVLVAIAILAVVATLAYRATAAMTESEARLSVETQRWQTLDALFTRLEADLRQAVPRPVRRGQSRDAAWSVAPGDSAGNSELLFTRAGPEFAIEPGVAGQRIGYRLREGAIEILYWPHLDNPANATPQIFPLASGVASFRVTALTDASTLSDRWPLPNEADIPRGAHVDLVLIDGTRIERWFALR
jgi:general secretion pathway protein J